MWDMHNITTAEQAEKNMSLYENINKRKASGTSRPKSKSTITNKAYQNMKAGFPKKKTDKYKKKA
jgi:hypothetical protein